MQTTTAKTLVDPDLLRKEIPGLSIIYKSVHPQGLYIPSGRFALYTATLQDKSGKKFSAAVLVDSAGDYLGHL